MPRVNVYLSDELVAAIRTLDLNLSRVLQGALRERLDQQRLQAWLEQLSFPGSPGATHQETSRALEAPAAGRRLG